MVPLLIRCATPALVVLGVAFIAASAWSSRTQQSLLGPDAAIFLGAVAIIVAIGMNLRRTSEARVTAAAEASGAADAIDLARFDSDKG